MLKIFCKIMGLAAFVSGCFLFTAFDCYAQKMDVMSAEEFAQKYATGDIRAIFEGGGRKVPCGAAEDLCETDTQVCLRCTREAKRTYWGLTLSSGVVDTGKCVSKSEYNPDNLEASWPACKTGEVDARIQIKKFGGEGTGIIYIQALKLEENGFISESEAKVFGIKVYKNKEGFTDAYGRKYELFMDGGKPTINYGNKGFGGCEVLPVKIYNMKKCFFCPIARIVFKAVNEVTASAFENFASSFMTLMAMVYAIWLAFVTLQQVFPMTKKDASDYIELILKQTLKFALGYLLLANANYLFQSFVSPILSAGLKMGEKIQDGQLMDLADVVETADVRIGGGYYNIKMASGATLYEQIERYLRALQSQMAYMQALGTSLFCVGTRQIIRGMVALLAMNAEPVKLGFRMMFLGGILTVCGFLLSLIFAFYFLDALLQLGILGMMMPLMIAGWPFKATSNYASKGLETLLNTFFVFFFTGFVISVNVILIDQSLSFSNSITSEVSTSGIPTEQADGFGAIAKAMNEQNIDALNDATNIGGIGFLLLIFASLFGFKFMTQVAPLASKLAGGAMSGGFSKVGTMAASTAKGMAMKAAQPVAGKIGEKFDEAGGVVGMASKGVSNAANKISDIASASGAKGVSEGFRKLGRGGEKFQDKVKDWRKKT